MTIKNKMKTFILNLFAISQAEEQKLNLEIFNLKLDLLSKEQEVSRLKERLFEVNILNYNNLKDQLAYEGQKNLIRDLCAITDYTKATYSWDSKSNPPKIVDSNLVKQINQTNKSYLEYEQVYTIEDIIDKHFKRRY